MKSCERCGSSEHSGSLCPSFGLLHIQLSQREDPDKQRKYCFTDVANNVASISFFFLRAKGKNKGGGGQF